MVCYICCDSSVTFFFSSVRLFFLLFIAVVIHHKCEWKCEADKSKHLNIHCVNIHKQVSRHLRTQYTVNVRRAVSYNDCNWIIGPLIEVNWIRAKRLLQYTHIEREICTVFWLMFSFLFIVLSHILLSTTLSFTPTECAASLISYRCAITYYERSVCCFCWNFNEAVFNRTQEHWMS